MEVGGNSSIIFSPNLHVGPCAFPGSAQDPVVISDDDSDGPTHEGGDPLGPRSPKRSSSIILVSQDASPISSAKSPQDIIHDLEGLDEVVEDIAAWFWDCQTCLGMGHILENGTNKVHCRKCFRLGHVKKGYNRSSPSIKLWVPKNIKSCAHQQLSPDSAFPPDPWLDSHDVSCSSAPQQNPPPSSSDQSPTTSPSPPPKASPDPMENFELDPRRFLLAGHDIVDGGPLRVPGLSTLQRKLHPTTMSLS